MLDTPSSRTPADGEDFLDEAESVEEAAPKGARGRFAGILGAFRRLRNFVAFQSFSSLTRRIVLLNLAGMVALVSGILYLSEFRAGLIDARVQSLLVQGEIIAAAIAGSAQVETNAITIDPERLLELQAGESYGPGEEGFAPLEFPINPERVAQVLKRLVEPTGTNARIYDRDGGLLLDSRSLYSKGEILRFEMAPPTERRPNWFEKTWNRLRLWFERGDLPLYKDLGPNNGKGYAEVADALKGRNAYSVQVNERGQVIVSVAVPVQRFRAILGALLLSTHSGEIEEAVTAERLVIVRVFLVAMAVMVMLSLLLAGTIAGPVRRLADAAERVRRRTRSRVEIPDFTGRSDEIGHLSGALRDMTDTLYSRIEAIESFAADVSHELKNPLTSLRSAVETLPLARNDVSRGRLMEVIQHDVKRLDRLITDISDASRLDAELQRQEAAPVDLTRLLGTVTSVHNDVVRGDGVSVTLAFEHAPGTSGPFIVPGHDSRLGQVINNLIDNARSFSPKGGEVRVTCRRLKDAVEIIVDDDGPGIPPHALSRIFERFYTDRPEEQGFGQNSGLGLSISRQIVEAHGGRIWAENRLADLAKAKPRTRKARPKAEDGEERREAPAAPRVAGARFIVRLPAV
ncbi:stimulus-sensing domain-containing protein [Ancylobacter amanitiformis]|uniref:histidine kinase n=1 Tax=Ancylobacter amanitiformis TaxID=217069 RepID=A0ABU0LTM7_9HYPH|nr:two-component system sensor histidine kinase ChvG [Ancylobacter amanitiformis]